MNCCYIYSPEHNNLFKIFLLKSIETLVLFYNKNINNIYILISNTIEDEEYNSIENKLNELVKDTNIKVILKLVDLNITNSIPYPENNRNRFRINRIGLLKFFIPYLVDVDDILYIDCDILFKDNIYRELIDNFNDNILIKIFHEGYNSGLIYFNCKNWRKHSTLFSEIINFYSTRELKLVDNECFQWIATERFKDICYCDNNRKINFPKEWHPWKDQNVIHVWGRILYKRKVFNEVYNRIINNIEI